MNCLPFKPNIAKLVVLLSSLFTLSPQYVYATSETDKWSLKSEANLRFDYNSDRGSRYQYRVRAYPSYQISENVGIHGFVTTGNRFASSHNTINASQSNYLYLRRLFVRQSDQYGKTEFGVIPTYKGRVSSTGLSKDGWIAGLRRVNKVANGQLEFVVGELDRLNQPSVFNSINKLNYYELEYSFDLTADWSAEFSAERLLGGNFLRTELRYEQQEQVYSVEFIYRLDNDNSKVVASWQQNIEIFNTPLELFSVYAHVRQGFGRRAELTEDFLEFGHAVSFELEPQNNLVYDLKWFSRLEFYEGQSRFLLGLKRKF